MKDDTASTSTGTNSNRFSHTLLDMTYSVLINLYFAKVTPHRMCLHVTDKWLKAIDEGKCTGTAFCRRNIQRKS